MGSRLKGLGPGPAREVALKVLWPRTIRISLRFTVREKRETAAALPHPNIVTIYDVGETRARRSS